MGERVASSSSLFHPFPIPHRLHGGRVAIEAFEGYRPPPESDYWRYPPVSTMRLTGSSQPPTTRQMPNSITFPHSRATGSRPSRSSVGRSDDNGVNDDEGGFPPSLSPVPPTLHHGTRFSTPALQRGSVLETNFFTDPRRASWRESAVSRCIPDQRRLDGVQGHGPPPPPPLFPPAVDQGRRMVGNIFAKNGTTAQTRSNNDSCWRGQQGTTGQDQVSLYRPPTNQPPVSLFTTYGSQPAPLSYDSPHFLPDQPSQAGEFSSNPVEYNLGNENSGSVEAGMGWLNAAGAHIARHPFSQTFINVQPTGGSMWIAWGDQTGGKSILQL